MSHASVGGHRHLTLGGDQVGTSPKSVTWNVASRTCKEFATGIMIIRLPAHWRPNHQILTSLYLRACNVHAGVHLFSLGKKQQKWQHFKLECDYWLQICDVTSYFIGGNNFFPYPSGPFLPAPLFLTPASCLSLALGFSTGALCTSSFWSWNACHFTVSRLGPKKLRRLYNFFFFLFYGR